LLDSRAQWPPTPPLQHFDGVLAPVPSGQAERIPQLFPLSPARSPVPGSQLLRQFLSLPDARWPCPPTAALRRPAIGVIPSRVPRRSGSGHRHGLGQGRDGMYPCSPERCLRTGGSGCFSYSQFSQLGPFLYLPTLADPLLLPLTHRSRSEEHPMAASNCRVAGGRRTMRLPGN